MSLNNFSYPHPILGNYDDITIGLKDDCVAAFTTTTDYYHEYRFVLSLEDNTVLELIKNHKAKYAVNVKCKRTLYQDRILSESNEVIVRIPRNYVLGKLDFQILVIATEEFNYRNPLANPIFMGCSFDIQPGDPLVFFPNQYDYLDITYHTLRHYSSILVPIPNEDLDDNDILVVTDERIKVNLSPGTFQMFKDVNTRENSVEIISSIVQVALTTALFKLFIGDGDSIPEADEIRNNEKAWVVAILTRMRNENGMPSIEDIMDSPYTEIPSLVQKLLHNPIWNLLYKINVKSNSTDEFVDENNEL